MGRILIGGSNGCWVDPFNDWKFRGVQRRLYGPADFPFLRVGEPKWGREIHSLIVGPSAYVQCFDQANFNDTVFWLLPRQSVENVRELDIPNEANSLRIFDRPPFAHEPGYGAYMLWAANHMASSSRRKPKDGQDDPKPTGENGGKRRGTRGGP